MGDGNDAGRPDAPQDAEAARGGDDEMEHYKKRLIQQVEESIMRDSHQSVMEMLAAAVPPTPKKPRAQRGRKRKTAQVALLKLGTGDPTALCKSKETYTASAENVHRQYENVTITGNAKTHKVSEDAVQEPPGAGRHVLPAIVPEIFGTSRRGRGRGRGRGNQRYQRRNAASATSRCMSSIGPPASILGEHLQLQVPDFLRFTDLERDITKIQNPIYPSDAEMIKAIETLCKSITQRDIVSSDNLMALNKFYMDLRRYHDSDKMADSKLKEQINVQMNELVGYASVKLIGYLDRYSVRYMRDMLLLDLQPHLEFFRKNDVEIKKRGKSHVWLRTFVQKLSKPEEFEMFDDPVRLVDLKKLQSKGDEEPETDKTTPDKTTPDVPAIDAAVENPSPFPEYFFCQNTGVTITHASPSPKNDTTTSISSSTGDAPSTITSEPPPREDPMEEPMEEPTDLTMRSTAKDSTANGTEDEEVPVKEEMEVENSAVQYYAQELRKFKKLVRDTNAMVYNEVLKQYRDNDVYFVDEEDEEGERHEGTEEAMQNHSTGTEEADNNHSTGTDTLSQQETPPVAVEANTAAIDVPIVAIDVPTVAIDVPTVTVEVPTVAIDVPTVTVEVPHVQIPIPSTVFSPPAAPHNDALTLPPFRDISQIPNGPKVNPGPKKTQVSNGSKVRPGTSGSVSKYPRVPNGPNGNRRTPSFAAKCPHVPNGPKVSPGTSGFVPKYSQIPKGPNVNPGTTSFAPKYPQVPNGPNVIPGTPGFAPKYPQVPNGPNVNPRTPGVAPKYSYVPPRPPAPPYPHMPPPPPPPIMEPLFELRRLSGGLGGAPNGVHPEAPCHPQFNNFSVPQGLQNLRDAEHYMRYHGSGGSVSVHGAQQEGRNPSNAIYVVFQEVQNPTTGPLPVCWNYASTMARCYRRPPGYST